MKTGCFDSQYKVERVKGQFKCYVTQWWGGGYTDQVCVTKLHDPTLLALRGGGWVGVNFAEKSVT